LRLGFDRRLKLKFLGSKVTTAAGPWAYRELDQTIGRTDMADKRAASTSEIGRFEKEIINTSCNLKKLMELSGEWISKVPSAKAAQTTDPRVR